MRAGASPQCSEEKTFAMVGRHRQHAMRVRSPEPRHQACRRKAPRNGGRAFESPVNKPLGIEV